MSNLFNLLKQRPIYDILIGDSHFGAYRINEDNSVIISMPYLRGQDLCRILTHFGQATEYSWNGGNLSRWQYMESLLEHCISKDKCSDLLSYLFDKKQFISILGGHSPEEIQKAYEHICKVLIDRINGYLFVGGNHLVSRREGFQVIPINNSISIETPLLNMIDNTYIKEITARSLNDIQNGNYDSALTKSRTLLEDTFSYIIELRGEQRSKSGDIKELYKQVKDLYSLHGDADAAKSVNTVLSGLEKIVTGVGEMRNMGGDAHGLGSDRVFVADYHARLFVNASMSMAEFILALANSSKVH